MMRIDRRRFLSVATAGSAGLALAQSVENEVTRGLKPMTAGIQPITDDERRARIDKAQRLMRENRIAAIFLEPGSSLYYYTGTRWPAGENVSAWLLPARGEAAWIVPAADEKRAHDMIRGSKDLRSWDESTGAYKRAAQVLKDRGIATGALGIEEQVRFFVFDGLRREMPALEYRSADAVTAGCRMIKSAAEIALMQRANDITIAALRAAFAHLREGMTSADLRANVSAAYRALGIPSGGGLVGLGKYSAFPHGSIQAQQLREGDIVLVDTGCNVEGYVSDITRTTVFGKPSARHRQVWELERKAQDAAFAAAKIGAACESVDTAARKVITDAGFGPGYKVPGLPHRTGHGIGLDGHEWTNLVRGNKTPLAAGMCFSDEPMIAIYGEFGVRLEDCFYMTESGPRMFTKQSPAIDQPFG